MATFGNILEELRKDRKMTQKELSEVIYVTTGTISNYENDRYLPDIEKLIMLATISTSQLITCLVALHII